MNTKKIIKYTLIAVPLLFLAKWGIESVIYNSNKTPEINPNPTHKMRIHGKFPFEDDVKLDMAILFITTNPKCDNNNWLAGIRFPQRFMKSFPATVKDGAFESDIYLDSYLPGMCEWQAHHIFALMKSTKDDMDISGSSIGLSNEQSEEKISAQNTQIGAIGHKPFVNGGKTLYVECAKEKVIRWKGLSKEKSLIEIQCLSKQDHFRSRDISNLIPDVSSSQQEVEINFIDKGWKK